MRLAFIILAHKNPEQLQLLIDKLLSQNCTVFIHLDKKAKSEFSKFIQKNDGRPGLRIYSRFKVYWGSYNQIRATFFLLREACINERFDFVKLISGQDLPVRPLDEFRTFLSEHRNAGFFSFSRLPDTASWAGRGGLDRMELFWITDFPRVLAFFFNKLNVVIHMIQNKLNLRRTRHGQLYGGANWFTLNREMADFVIEEINRKPEIMKRYRYTRLADEIFLQTLLLNSKFATQVINTPLCLIDWQTGPEYPRTFTSEDVDRIRSSGEFFARKFDIHKDREVIHTLLNTI